MSSFVPVAFSDTVDSFSGSVELESSSATSADGIDEKSKPFFYRTEVISTEIMDTIFNGDTQITKTYFDNQKDSNFKIIMFQIILKACM